MQLLFRGSTLSEENDVAVCRFNGINGISAGTFEKDVIRINIHKILPLTYLHSSIPGGTSAGMLFLDVFEPVVFLAEFQDGFFYPRLCCPVIHDNEFCR